MPIVALAGDEKSEKNRWLPKEKHVVDRKVRTQAAGDTPL